MSGIEDVARLAGVSTATVSRALSGKTTVSEKALAKVEAAAKQLNYTASASAYTLATGRTRNIGVVLPFVDTWFFSVILQSIESELTDKGFDLTLYNLSGGLERRRKVFFELVNRKRVDAFIAVAVKPSEEELAQLAASGIPMLSLGGPIAGVRTVAVDEVHAGRLATQHLIDLGHTKIAIISGAIGLDFEFDEPNLRRHGYLEALKAADLSVKASWLAEADFSMANAYKVATQLLKDRASAPTAIFAVSDEMAIGALMAARDLGLKVPQDVSIVGMDNHVLAEFFGLTTVSQDAAGQGANAARCVMELLDNPDSSRPINVEENEVWPVELIVRASTAAPSNK
jgi:DNA-binding LacI/PurR family transcriptional regulator